MFAHQRERSLLQPKRGAFLDPHLRMLGRSAIGGEHRNVGVDPERIIAPMAGDHHAAVEVEDSGKLLAFKGGNRAPVPRRRERRDDAQALLTFGCG